MTNRRSTRVALEPCNFPPHSSLADVTLASATMMRAGLRAHALTEAYIRRAVHILLYST